MKDTGMQALVILIRCLGSVVHNLKYFVSAIVAIVLTTVVFSFFISVSNGISSTLLFSSSDHVLVASRRGANIEATSVVAQSEVNLLNTYLSNKIQGSTIISPETYLSVSVKQDENTPPLPLPMRGISQRSIDTRPGFLILTGRMPRIGTTEVIVGQALANSLNFSVSDTLSINGENWSIVGLFSSGGNLYESELWSSLESTDILSRRGHSYQSIRILLDQNSSIAMLTELFEREADFATLEVRSLTDYYSDLVEPSSRFINAVALPVTLFLGLGAAIALYVSSSASLKARLGDLIILHRIGFSKSALSVSLLIESLCLCILSGILGFTIAYFAFDGRVASTSGIGLIVTVFKLETSLEQAVSIIAIVSIISLLGTLSPTYRLFSINSDFT